MYRVLASLAPACNDHFTTLLLPAAITIDPARELLVLPHYDGEDLAARWDESDGGALLGPGLAAAVPAVLEDLARISTATVLTDLALSAIPSLVFDHDAALTRSAGIARQLTRAGLLTRDDCAQAGRLLAHQQHTPMIVNNGDFYPRNLIVQPTGRIVIIDWETYNPNSPSTPSTIPRTWLRSSTPTCGATRHGRPPTAAPSTSGSASPRPASPKGW